MIMIKEAMASLKFLVVMVVVVVLVVLVASSLASTAEAFSAAPHTAPGTTPALRAFTAFDDGSMANLPQSSLFKTADPKDSSCINNRHSASDWLYNVFSLPKSSVLREIKNPVITIALWSSFVSVVQRLFARSASKTLQKASRDMCIGSTPHSFLVSSLGLLLVFRTNSAYQRFYEGRKIWENILSISRNISRMVSLYGKEVGVERLQRIKNLIAAFPYLLRHHIRPGCLCDDPDLIGSDESLLLHEPSIEMVETRHDGDKQTVGGTTQAPSYYAAPPRECWVNKKNLPWCLLEEDSLKKLSKAHNRPLWTCDRIGREIMDISYGPNFTSRERLTLLRSVEKLTDTVGQCERIHQTAVPLNYARHSLRSLTLWLFTLPFAMVKDLGLLTGPVMGVTAWLLFGVYQIGYSIEDPFQGSLRLSTLCDAIRRDVVGEDDNRLSAFSSEDDRKDTDAPKSESILGLIQPPPLGLLDIESSLLSSALTNATGRI